MRLASLRRGPSPRYYVQATKLLLKKCRGGGELLPAPEVESRTQGSSPRPRTQKKSEAKDKDSLSEDRHSRGQGHKRKCSPKKRSSKNFSGNLKKKVFTKFFRQSPQKNVFQKFFQALHKILTIQRIVLSSSRGQANFRGLEAKAKDFKMCPRGQGRPRGLHLWPALHCKKNP